jgi:hypothetical protein
MNRAVDERQLCLETAMVSISTAVGRDLIKRQRRSCFDELVIVELIEMRSLLLVIKFLRPTSSLGRLTLSVSATRDAEK